MSRKFKDFIREVEAEAKREGPKSVAELAAFGAHFKLAAEFIELRRRRGLTQRQLSALSGIQQAEISRIEGGRANPTFQTIQVLARALGASVRLDTRTTGRRGVGTRSAARSSPAHAGSR